MSQIDLNRQFMKSAFGSLPGGTSDQSQGKPQPQIQVPYPPESTTFPLPKPDPSVISRPALFDCIGVRRSRRRWTSEALSLEELAYLLWATQGVEEVLGDGYATLRTVPSGGARHPFETYLVINQVTDLTPGVYRYLPLTHELLFCFGGDDVRENLHWAVFGQKFVSEAPVVFIWTCIPYRGEWRYTVAAHKVMLLDAGHVCQSLYLAAESIDAGTCAVGAYSQEAMDQFLRIDGEDEFVVYLAPVGKPRG